MSISVLSDGGGGAKAKWAVGRSMQILYHHTALFLRVNKFGTIVLFGWPL